MNTFGFTTANTSHGPGPSVNLSIKLIAVWIICQKYIFAMIEVII